MVPYPKIEPLESGLLETSDGNRLYWEVCGNPSGKPAVVLHGGPGSGCTPGWRRYFDPAAYRIVLFDQRGCGRSTPHASDPAVGLEAQTTAHQIADIELLRAEFGVDRWLVLGGSWGTTLGLAYAEQHPENVSEMVLFSVGISTRREVEWLTRDVGRLVPEEWARFRDGVPEADRDGSLVDAYARLLADPDPAVREKAAADWCEWEDVHIAIGSRPVRSPRYEDPAFRMCFARLVTHYVCHDAWLEEDELLRGIGALDGIPAVLVQGRFDFQAPLGSAWAVHRAWPSSELVLVDDAGHDAGAPRIEQEIVRATDRFAS